MTQPQDNKKDDLIENEEQLNELRDELQEDFEEENFVEEGKEFPHVIENLEKEIEALKESLARKQADYENLSARVEREKAEMTFYVTSKVASKFLWTVDNLERMIDSTPESDQDSPLFKGIESTTKTLKKELDSMGIKPYESIGQQVDPHKHDVMTGAPGELDTVVSEFEKGYEMDGKVIRHAKVVAWLWE